ncbi:hypothetical protein ACQ4PT_029607 [Festuca glaucescens]
MADVKAEKKEKEARKKRHERRVALLLQSSAEEYWYPNQEESQEGGRNAGDYFAARDPYLLLTGPTRAVVTCMDPGTIEIVLKVKGATESDDRDLSFLVLTLKSGGYCSFDGDYNSKRSTLKLQFHHIYQAVEATISVRLTCGSSLPPGGFQGVFTASTTNIDNAEILLLAFKDARLSVADDGTISLSRRVVSVGYGRSDRLKVSILARSDEETGEIATGDAIVFIPQKHGTSCGVLNAGVCKMQVTVAWSLLASSSFNTMESLI